MTWRTNEKEVRALRSSFVAALLALVLLFQPLSARVEAPEEAGVLRALLVACDDFVTQPDTAPSSYNNLISLRRALLRDARGYRSIRVSLNQALDGEGFRALAAEAFSGAGPRDMSLVYLSTHGLQSGDGQDFVALMSDGTRECGLSGADIHRALRDIPGVKVLILDACFSGAAIGKGLDAPRVSSPFTGPDFKVLTSAGGDEPSFLWTDGEGTVRGGSYFAQALTEGLNAFGGLAADANGDGAVTLAELHAHQLRAYGASTPQLYPEGDATPLFVASHTDPGVPRPLTRLEFASRVLKEEGESLDFSYTLHEPSRLAYQLVYELDGAWRFGVPQNISEEGVLPAGRRQVSLRILKGMEGLSGYLLLFIVAVDEDRAWPLSCVLLSVQTKRLDPALSLAAAPAFRPGAGEEASFVIRHTGAVSLTARIVDPEGRQVRALLRDETSRPMHLNREGSTLCWNGKTDAGEPASPGVYLLEVSATAGGLRYAAPPAAFELKP